MSDEETMPVEQDDLAEQLAMEKERLDKLYVAYQAIESELADAKAHIEVLEKDAIDKEIEKEGLGDLLNEKDSRIRNLEIESAKAGTRVKHLEPELEKMEEMYTREQARLGRVFDVAEELDEALQTATSELKARDDWYVEHMKIFEDIKKVTETRFEMIDGPWNISRSSRRSRILSEIEWMRRLRPSRKRLKTPLWKKRLQKNQRYQKKKCEDISTTPVWYHLPV